MKIICNNQKKYNVESRKWQGVPTIEKTGNRIWASWYSGGKYEPSLENYAVVMYTDDGETYLQHMIIDGDEAEGYRILDPQLWKDNDGRLWLFWHHDIYSEDAVSIDFDTPIGERNRMYFQSLELWAMCCENPEGEEPLWSKPRYICSGLLKNNPIILKNGRWLLSVHDKASSEFEFYIKFVVSDDNGESFVLKTELPEKSAAFSEPMTVQLRDGTLRCLIRTGSGYINETYSYDNGETWTEQKQTEIPNPSTRFFIGRLNSGELMLINTPSPTMGDRKSLVVSLSEDEGKTWAYNLMIDDRRGTTYPDVALSCDGYIYIIYDCQRDNRHEVDAENPQRSNAAKEICCAKITVEDIKNGSLISKEGFLRKIISKVHYSERKLG